MESLHHTDCSFSPTSCVCVCVFRLGFFQKSHYRTWPQSSEPKYLWKVQDFYLHDAILCLSGRLKMTENDNQNKINGLLKKKEDCWCGARLWEPYGFAHPHRSLWKQDDSFDFEKRGGKKGNFFEIKLKCSDNFAFYRTLAFNPRPNPFRKCLKLSASDRNECLPASDFSIK